MTKNDKIYVEVIKIGGLILEIIVICQELTKEIPSEQISMNEKMSKHTSFKVGGTADIFVILKNINERSKKND